MKIKSLISFLSLFFIAISLIFMSSNLKLAASDNQYFVQNKQFLVADNHGEDLDYMVSLALMKGHLIVGKELLELKEFKEAEPHFGHPVEEIYGDLEMPLQMKNVPQFKITLTKLHELVKFSPENPLLNSQYDAAIDAIDKAIKALPESELTSPKFVVAVINGLLATTNEEYTAAIIEDKVVENVEYQDSRGFVLYSEILYQTISNQLKNDNPELNTNLAKTLSEIKQAFPDPMPPNPVVKTPQELSQLIGQFKEDTKKVTMK